MSPLFDDLATVRFARADLQQIITPALTRNDLAKARTGWTAFKAKYPAALDLVKFRSVTAAKKWQRRLRGGRQVSVDHCDGRRTDAARGDARDEGGCRYQPGECCGSQLRRDQEGLDRHRPLSGVRAARHGTPTAQEPQRLAKGDYTSAKTAVGVAQNQAYLRVGPALALRSSDAALSSALKGYADLTGAAGDAAK